MDQSRYSRQIILPEIGLSGQQKLSEAKVLVVGAGGLGCPVLQYLTGAGVGRIGIIDHDVVDLSNLHRQILYTVQDVGSPKAAVAAKRMTALNPDVHVDVYTDRLTQENVTTVFDPYDIVVDGSDNFETRYLVNDACIQLNKVLVFGSIFKFEGQVSVFNYENGPSYRCIFPEAPQAGEVPTCSEIGVLGVLPGIIGSFQANEVIKVITGAGDVLSGKLLVYNALNNSQYTLKVNRVEEHFNRRSQALRQAQKPVDGYACSAPEEPRGHIEGIHPSEALARIQRDEPFLLDVRTPEEFEICNIKGSTLIPLDQLANRWDEIPKDKPVLAICHHGFRSQHALEFLQAQKFENLLNLEGGIHQWALQVDAQMPTY